MNQDELKRLVGAAALDHVRPDSIIGVGTGSTVNCFIDVADQERYPYRGCSFQF